MPNRKKSRKIQLGSRVAPRDKETIALTNLIADVPDPMAIVDVDGEVRRINPHWQDLFGYPAEELVGRGLVMVLRPAESPTPDWTRGWATWPPRAEMIGRRKDGTRFPVDVSTVSVTTAEGAVGLIAARDLNDRWQAEERVLRAHEDERRRIADDIHDDSVQAVTAASLRLQLLRHSLHDPSQLAIVSALEELLDMTMVGLRRLMFELRPPALEGSGIAAAIREMLEDLRRETGVAFEIQTRLRREPPAARRSLFYRIVEEAVKRASSSAGLRLIRIDLEDDDDGWIVRLGHDGAGADGNGVLRERARLAGGWALVEPSIGAEHRIHIWIPNDHSGRSGDTAADAQG